MTWASLTLDELIDACEQRNILVSDDDTVEALVSRLELWEVEQELDAEIPAPKPTPTPVPIRRPVQRKKTARKTAAVKPAPTPAPTPVPAPSDGVRVAPYRQGLPGTHQPVNLDPEVRFVVLPDGRRRPMIVDG